MVSPPAEVRDYNQKTSSTEPVRVLIPDHCAGLRLDRALARLLPDYSRSRLAKWVRDGKITLDGAAASASRKVWPGAVVLVSAEPDPAATAFAPEQLPLDIVFEDDSLIVLNKPAGVVVHPGSGNWRGTLLNALLHHAPSLSGLPRAGIVHRLDKETSGLLVVAKTLTAHASLVRQLGRRSVRREYLALAAGRVARDGTVEAPIGRHPVQRTRMSVAAAGKPAVTHYRVLEQLPGCTLLACSLETGRTHQIRVHLHSIGHPLVGDPVYRTRRGSGNETLDRFARQALHARRLGFIHPASGQPVEFEAELPSDFSDLLCLLRAKPGESPH